MAEYKGNNRLTVSLRLLLDLEWMGKKELLREGNEMNED